MRGKTLNLKFKKFILLALAFLCLVLFAFNVNANFSYADEVQFGHLTSNSVNVRTGPGTEHATIPSNKSVNASTFYEVLGTDNDTTGTLWYKIKVSDTEVGYVRNDLFVLVSKYTEDGDFEKYLSDQGFPESYKPYLRDLHAKYPKWVFKAAQTGIDWQTAVNAESNPANLRKVVYPSQPESWRSVERYAYSLIAGTDYDYTGYVKKYDGGTFYAASESIVKYYMDPRNFMGVQTIFEFLQLSYDPNSQTKEGLQLMLSGTFMEGDIPEEQQTEEYKTYADVIMLCAAESGVSPYDIASIIIQEQGNDGHGGNINNDSGYYNFFNIGASGSDAIAAGIARAEKEGWDSIYKSILGGAKWYAKQYISDGQDTKYFVNWNVNMGSKYLAQYQYATYIGDTTSKTALLYESYANFLDTSLTFLIPVFKNMPEDASPMPPQSGNNLNFLSNIEVDGYTLNTSFNPYTYSYDLVVASSVTEVEIAAIAFGGTISGIGNIKLNSGDNSITKVSIVVTASSGVKRTYTITIAKAQGGQTGPQYSSDSLKFDTYLTGVEPGINCGSLKNLIKISDGSISILDKDGNVKESGKVITGDRVIIKDSSENVTQDIAIAIRGDINSDGNVSSGDLILIRRHLLGSTTLSNANLQAADINKDNAVNTGDLICIRKSLLGLYSIVQ